MHRLSLTLLIFFSLLTACTEPAREVCIPACDDRTCGPDGCGGTCGSCADFGEQCRSGQCIPAGCTEQSCQSACVPSCENRECGPDACGGSCGSCQETEQCNESTGMCMNFTVRGNLSFESYDIIYNAYVLPTLSQIIDTPAESVPVSYRNIDGIELDKTVVKKDGSFEFNLPRLPQSSDWISITPAWYVAGKLKAAVLRPKGEEHGSFWTWNIPVKYYADIDHPGDLQPIRITIEQKSGALSLFLQLVKAYDSLISYGIFTNVGRLPSMAILWEPGKSWSCGTCYVNYPTTVGSWQSNTSMYIGAGEKDESAWGYPTFLHEFGHFVLDQKRDDNPGGMHGISSISEPQLAWSEGWATFYALLMMSLYNKAPVTQYWRVLSNGSYWIDYAHIYDSLGSGSVYIPSPKIAYDMTQNLCEAWVTWMLWDFFDGKEIPDPSMPADGIELGTKPLISAISSDRYLKLQHYDNKKSPKNADFVDFVEALICSELQKNNSQNADQIMDLLIERGFPYDREPVCNRL